MVNSQTKRENFLPKGPDEGKKAKIKPVFIILIIVCTAFLLAVLCGLQHCSIYQMIVRNGYTGTQEQWVASLVGEEADTGDAETAYELAVKNGYKGTEADWIETLIGVAVDDVQESPYMLACENGFEGSLSEWLTEIADKPENLGKSDDGQKTEYDLACEYGYSGTFIEWIVSVANDRVFE